jgi:sterol desaturase/sphingolipid hydroxylase (fatty acid hydroxylase superfamily)
LPSLKCDNNLAEACGKSYVASKESLRNDCRLIRPELVQKFKTICFTCPRLQNAVMNFEPFLTVFVFACVFAPLEILLPAKNRPSLNWQRYRTDFFHTIFGGYAIRLGTAATITWIVARAGIWGNAHQLPLWLELPALLLISDLAFWLAHRLFHAIPLLWQFHRIHHSSEHLDWLASFRVHPVDQIVNATIIAAPVLLLGFSPLAVLIYGLFYQWHAIFLHSNVRAGLGPLSAIFTTPKFHHWHHANQPDAYDKNFGGQLVFWDKLFGTAKIENEYPDQYGIDHPLPENFLSHILEPFGLRRDK